MKKWLGFVLSALVIPMLFTQQTAQAAERTVGHTLDLTSSSAAITAPSYHYPPARAFDNDPVTLWNSGQPTGWVGNEFQSPVVITKYTLRTSTGWPLHMPKDWTFEGYDTASESWVVLDTRSHVTGWNATPYREFVFANSQAFTKYRINVSSQNGAGYVGIGEIEMMAQNPLYTDDVTTGGIATASSISTDSQQTTFNPAYAFDDKLYTVDYWNGGSVPGQSWLQYEFPEPKRIGRYTLIWQQFSGSTHYMVKSWTFEGYDETAGQWVVLDTQTNQTGWVLNQWRAFTFDNMRSFKKYRLHISASNNNNRIVGIGEMQMMEIIGEPLQIDMDTTNTAPYGGQLFDTYLVSRNATDLASEQVTVTYDPTLYELHAAVPQQGVQIASQDASVPGLVTLNVTNNGAVFSTTAETRLIKLTFRAKDKPGTGWIETTAASAISTTGMNRNALLGGEQIKVSVKNGDINLDGYVTTADLAMAAKLYNDIPSGLYSRADIDQNGAVDGADLQYITDRLESILFGNGGPGYTYDLTQGGDVTASSSHLLYQYYQPRYAFDSDTTSGFYWNAGTKVPSGWLQYDFRFPQRIGKYSLRWQTHTGYEAYMPKSWTFEGYDEQTAQWVVLDTQLDQSGWVTGQKREFEFANANYYKKYRINISASNHALYVGVGEMEMFGIVANTMQLSLNPGTGELYTGDAFPLLLKLTTPNDIYAEQVVVNFDPEYFDYNGATALAGSQIYKEEVLAPGKIRFTIAQQGGENEADEPQYQFAELQFTSKKNPPEDGQDFWYANIYATGTVGTSNGVDITPIHDENSQFLIWRR